MTQHTRTKPWPLYARVPPFVPVPMRTRRDGWTAARQAWFLGMLAQTGSISAAAQAVGMSRMAAYRLRKAAPASGSFAHAWKVIETIRTTGDILPGWKVTPEEIAERALEGPFHVVMRRGKFVHAGRKPNGAMLLRWLGQLDQASVVAGQEALEWQGGRSKPGPASVTRSVTRRAAQKPRLRRRVTV